MSGYELVVGLEIHAQLVTKTKAFCRCANRYGAEPNTLVCPVCLGTPGALPVFNREVVAQATRLAIALGADIHLHSRFDRKNYFYPDLPKGYQISQFDHPFSTGGHLSFIVNGSTKSINITRAHLEEDAGKSMHLADGSTIVDLNRCGVPLIEIVSEPEFRAAEEAGAYLSAMRELLRFIGVCDGNMDEGSLRCDANVSVRKIGEPEFRERCEMKNLNSIRSVERAIAAETKRQIAIYEQGGVIHRQTLQWNEQEERLIPMRVKEGSDDYRYFPEPDLPELRITQAFVDDIRASMPMLPEQLREKYSTTYKLNREAVYYLATDIRISGYTDTLIETGSTAQSAAKWVMGPVTRSLNERGWSFDEFSRRVPAATLSGLIQKTDRGDITLGQANAVFKALIVKPEKSPDEIVAELGIEVMRDEVKLGAIISEIVSEHPEELAKFREGKTKMVGFFMGLVMQATKGQADAQLAKNVLMELLEAKE